MTDEQRFAKENVEEAMKALAEANTRAALEERGNRPDFSKLSQAERLDYEWAELERQGKVPVHPKLDIYIAPSGLGGG